MEGLNGLWLLLTYFANSDMGWLLPISPFQRWIAGWDGWEVIEKYMRWINWFIPIGTLLNILAIWLSAIAVFYAIMAILRWVKIVGD